MAEQEAYWLTPEDRRFLKQFIEHQKRKSINDKPRSQDDPDPLAHGAYLFEVPAGGELDALDETGADPQLGVLECDLYEANYKTDIDAPQDFILEKILTPDEEPYRQHVYNASRTPIGPGTIRMAIRTLDGRITALPGDELVAFITGTQPGTGTGILSEYPYMDAIPGQYPAEMVDGGDFKMLTCGIPLYLPEGTLVYARRERRRLDQTGTGTPDVETWYIVSLLAIKESDSESAVYKVKAIPYEVKGVLASTMESGGSALLTVSAPWSEYITPGESESDPIQLSINEDLCLTEELPAGTIARAEYDFVQEMWIMTRAACPDCSPGTGTGTGTG